MDRKKAFQILNIEETKEEQKIKSAYLAHLKETNPEDDPEGFKRLREAYETAVSFANQPDEEAEKDIISLWLDRVNEVYENLKKRIDPECWRVLFSDSVMQELDTSMDATYRFIEYLMDHIYFPWDIWKVIDEELHIMENMSDLKTQFPENFLQYVKRQIQIEPFFCYDLFQILDEKAHNVDGYMEEYFSIKRIMDGQEEGDVLKKLNELPSYGLYHPYEDVEKIRLFLKEGDRTSAISLADELSEKYTDNIYILIYIGMVRWEQQKFEEAGRVWEKVRESCPDSYQARKGLAQYYFQKENYEEAKALLLDLLEETEDEDLESLLKQVNGVLINRYQEEIKGGQADEKSYLELGWCFLQDRDLEKAVELINSFEPSAENECEYRNLCGRVLFTRQEYDKALPYLERWLELLEELKQKQTDSENPDRRLQRYGLAHYMISACLYETGQYQKAVEKMQRASEAANDFYESQNYLNRLAHMYLDEKEYKKCVDICDRLVTDDPSYYPGYVARLEACYELDNDQQVVDDYYRAIELYPNYYMPYLCAAKVFFYHNQYEDAKGVLERASENEVVFSDQMRLYEVKVLRNLAKNRKDRRKPMMICQELLKAIRNPETDIEDKSEVEYEIGLLHWDNEKYKKAIQHIKTAIYQNPERMQYHLILGDVMREGKRYQEAIQEYRLTSQSYYEKEPRLYYSWGYCHEQLSEYETAIEKYEKVVELDEKLWDVNLRLADLYTSKYEKYNRKSDHEKAIYYMSRELEKEENTYNLIHRGLIYMKEMDIEHAVRDYKRAMEISPDDWVVYNNMAYTYKCEGRYEEAISLLQKAADILKEQGKKNELPYSNMADCYEILGDYENALLCNHKNLEIFPERYVYWKEIGDIYYEIEEYEKALEAYWEAKKNSACPSWIYLDSIGNTYYNLGDVKKAIFSYMDAVRKCKKGRAECWDDLGYFYLIRMEDDKKAQRCFELACECSRKDGEEDLEDYLDSLAELYFQRGDLENSRKYAEMALKYYLKGYDSEEVYLSYPPYRVSRYEVIGRLNMYMGNYEKALNCFQVMECSRPCKNCECVKCYEVFVYRGMYYERMGQLSEALAAYEKGRQYKKNRFFINRSIERLRKKLYGDE